MNRGLRAGRAAWRAGKGIANWTMDMIKPQRQQIQANQRWMDAGVSRHERELQAAEKRLEDPSNERAWPSRQGRTP